MVDRMLELYEHNTYKQLAKIINKEFNVNHTPNAVRKAYERYKYPIKNSTINKAKNGPKILIFDIETAPMKAYIWRVWGEQNIGLNQMESDWHVLSWAAKWYGEDEVMYEDQRTRRNMENDKKILKSIWKLLDQADIVVTQNGNTFDIKKLNARFILNGMKPPSSFRKIDTKKLAKKYFGFTRNSLAYLTDKLCTKYKKLDHAKFKGFDLWMECLNGNPEAWDEMEQYNKYDVLSLEELFEKLIPWDTGINFTMYDEEEDKCSCGSTKFRKAGYYYTNAAKYQKYSCTNCGAEYRDSKNLVNTKEKKIRNSKR